MLLQEDHAFHSSCIQALNGNQIMTNIVLVVMDYLVLFARAKYEFQARLPSQFLNFIQFCNLLSICKMGTRDSLLEYEGYKEMLLLQTQAIDLTKK